MVDEASAAAEGLSEELTGWVKRHRLQKCAAAIARVAGANILPSDLQYLTDENIEELGRTRPRCLFHSTELTKP